QGAEPQRSVRATDRAGHRRVVDAEQGESPRGTVHEAGRGEAGSKGFAAESGRSGRSMNDATEAAASAPDSRKALNQARLTGLKTIVSREFSRISRIWARTIVPSAVT